MKLQVIKKYISNKLILIFQFKFIIYNEILRFRSDLESFSFWCSINGMNFFNSRCTFISFGRRRKKITFNFIIGDYSFKNITGIRVFVI